MGLPRLDVFWFAEAKVEFDGKRGILEEKKKSCELHLRRTNTSGTSGTRFLFGPFSFLFPFFILLLRPYRLFESCSC